MKKHKDSGLCALYTIFIVALVTLILLNAFSVYKFFSLDKKIKQSQMDIQSIEGQLLSLGSVTGDKDLLSIIEFLEKETEKHRVFIEDQEQYLIKVISILCSGAIAMLAFFGIKSKKDIEGIVKEKYMDTISSEFNEIIGGSENREYLKMCIAQEKRAKEKRILIIQQMEDRKIDNCMRKFIDYSEDKCIVEKLVFKNYDLDSKKIKEKINKSNIIVYEVGLKEVAKRGEESPEIEMQEYNKINHLINENTYCLHYCPQDYVLDSSKFSQEITIANTYVSLVERFDVLLNF